MLPIYSITVISSAVVLTRQPAPQPRKLARFPCPPHKILEDPKNGLLEHSRHPKPPSPSIPSRQHGVVVVVTVSACRGRVATNSSRPSRSSFSVAVPVSVTFGFFHTHPKHGILRAASSSPNASKANGLRVAHGHASKVTKARNEARDFLQLSQEASTVVDQNGPGLRPMQGTAHTSPITS